ncbi:uncharacterized [Tachysurus ichikawai]
MREGGKKVPIIRVWARVKDCAVRLKNLLAQLLLCTLQRGINGMLFLIFPSRLLSLRRSTALTSLAALAHEI